MVVMTQDERPDTLKPLSKPTSFGPVVAWSYSALKVFEECPYRTYISRVKRIPEPSSPAADRGSQIHDEAEKYVDGRIEEFPDSLMKFEKQFADLRAGYLDGTVELEGEWGFTTDWKPTGWLSDDTWARIKLDAYVMQDKTSARVIDYKTGKRFGNEIAHSQQCLLYAIAAFARDPDLEYVRTELWYLDKAETATQDYTRKEAMQFMPSFHERGVKMTTETEFAPTPSSSACRWCSYRKGEHPECQWGVDV